MIAPVRTPARKMFSRISVINNPSRRRDLRLAYSSGRTEGHHLSRTRGCFGIRVGRRPGLLGKRIQLRLHKFSLNSKNLLEILDPAQFVYAFDGRGDILVGTGFYFFN